MERIGDTVYIGTAQDLKDWLDRSCARQYLGIINDPIKVKLIVDINMSGIYIDNIYDHTTTIMYCTEFDGQGYNIQNMVISSSEDVGFIRPFNAYSSRPSITDNFNFTFKNIIFDNLRILGETVHFIDFARATRETSNNYYTPYNIVIDNVHFINCDFQVRWPNYRPESTANESLVALVYFSSNNRDSQNMTRLNVSNCSIRNSTVLAYEFSFVYCWYSPTDTINYYRKMENIEMSCVDLTVSQFDAFYNVTSIKNAYYLGNINMTQRTSTSDIGRNRILFNMDRNQQNSMCHIETSYIKILNLQDFTFFPLMGFTRKNTKLVYLSYINNTYIDDSNIEHSINGLPTLYSDGGAYTASSNLLNPTWLVQQTDSADPNVSWDFTNVWTQKNTYNLNYPYIHELVLQYIRGMNLYIMLNNTLILKDCYLKENSSFHKKNINKADKRRYIVS